ncbi:hypothetical protein PVAND_016480 [Polypedilum vanderplanki]|uniref:Uncharacterized protein n=1 Tax=Polypedilum vanderplanki TaxID=319348 RepID=A0A9J6BGE3_POLVA|nr:hypothetical protein PVAND_016480 [Polypedilum vanderplanki]
MSIVNIKCYIRAYNRRTPAINIENKKIRKFEHLKLNIFLFHKLQIDDNDRMILHLENIEVCKILEGSSTTQFLKSFIDWLTELFPNYTKICTILGQINFNNITVPDSSFIKVFPVGRYLSVFSYVDDVDKNVMQLNSTVVITK